jgi:hypothetical protein
MANHILVFCASPEPLSLREVGEYIATIGLLDHLTCSRNFGPR